jgi:hypothetical protein
VTAATPAASSAPPSLAAAANHVTRPRRSARAPSSRYATTPVYSGPTEKPIPQRRSGSSPPAAGPICAWVGSSPVASMAAVIGAIEISITGQRP